MNTTKHSPEFLRLRLSEKLHTEIQALASKLDIGKSALTRLALREYIDQRQSEKTQPTTK